MMFLRRLLVVIVFMGGTAYAASAAHFLAEQVHDPLNPTLSYNLGIAALEQKNYPAAERHFSLAVDLYDRQNSAIVPAYFCWADTAALQLLGMLEGQKELKEEALSTAIKRAVDASNRYGNVLVFDAEHEAAQERKKIIDRLRALLEQQKKQQEEQKKQQEQNKKEQNKEEEEKSDQNKEKGGNEQEKEQQQGQDGNEGSSGQEQQKNNSQQSPQGGGSDSEQKSSGSQSREESEESEKSPQSGAQRTEAEPEEMTEQTAPEQEREGDRQEALRPEEADRQPNGADKGGTEQKGVAPAQDENVSDEIPQEGGEAAVATQAEEYDANAEMIKKRAMVLLDRLQQNEAALQKQQLLKKSAAQMGEGIRYNQW